MRVIFDRTIGSLSEEEKKLSHIANALPLFMRGIGVHHSGVMPLLRELVEVLYAQQLIKLIFTPHRPNLFPCSSVLMTSMAINGEQYHKMSGEAGWVISIVDRVMEADEAKAILKGQTDILVCNIRPNFNMVLNGDAERIVKGSFSQFQRETTLHHLITSNFPPPMIIPF